MKIKDVKKNSWSLWIDYSFWCSKLQFSAEKLLKFALINRL